MPGIAKMMEKDAVMVPNMNTGRRLRDNPGQRMLMIVPMKFTAPTVVEMPRKIRPRA